jgi:hypothetical protein
MKRKVKMGLGVAAGALVLAAAGVGVAVAGPNDQDVTGPAADKARAAAIQAIPGTAGRVEQETNEGAAYYGVMVTKADGTKLEVHEDQNFKVLGTEAPDND